MKMYDILEKKKNNEKLPAEELEFVVNGYTNNQIPDYQMSALLMAIAIQGMDEDEVKNLTISMINSGEKLDLSSIKGNIVDKHSTGGVGDKTTLIISPIVACLGCKIAKMSGKGLGYTGGTIDKLESIGVKVNLEKEDFFKQVNEIGIAVISQTANLAKSDKKIYALRDVTATVESIPLIASSIMSKKIASGSKNLVLDVKCGSGAFMKNLGQARKLGKELVTIGKMCNINTISIITNMDEPLGNKIGNLLEIEEAIEVLQNKGPEDITNLSIILASHMVALANSISFEKAKRQVLEVLQNGQAYQKFEQWITYQNGVLDIPKAKYRYEVFANQEGYLASIQTEEIGKLSCALGSGREKKEDTIDYTAGIELKKKTAEYINKGDLLAILYSSKIENLQVFEKVFLSTISYQNSKPAKQPIVLDKIGK